MSQELLTRLFKGAKNTKQTVWPGTEEKIYIRVATEKDFDDATSECDTKYKDRSGMWAYNAATYDAEKANRILHKVITSDGEKARIGSFDQFQVLLTPEVRDSLEDQWNSFQDECSPDPDAMSDDVFESLITEVKKKPEEAVQGIFSLFVLRKVSAYLAKQVVKLQADNSST